MVFLFVLVVFFGSVDKEPFAKLIEAPSAEACAAKAAEQSALAEKDPEVRGYTIKCVVVPDKT